MKKQRMTYKDAGVDIQKAENSLTVVKAAIKRTHNPKVLADIGLFGGFFRLPEGYRNPVLVASTDGVGTKLKVAIMANRHDTIGADLVNHCINDIATSGARPLFFLDYFAMGQLEPGVFQSVVTGIAAACEASGVALIGGETAEMPDFYRPGEYDISGTIVGIVEEAHIINGKQIQEGDQLIGIASNGLHTNGYTLARRVLLNHFQLDEIVPELKSSLADELLRVHINYFKEIQTAITTGGIHGIAHITGGGIENNTRRLLPEGLSLAIHWEAWERPAIFQLIQQLGNVPEEDMRQTFNLGIGLVLVVSPNFVAAVMERLKKQSPWPVYHIGEVVSR